MRVLHVIPSLGPARGGPSVAARLMARASVRAGLTVDVATTNDNDSALLDVPLNEPVSEDGVRYHYFARDARPYTVSRALAAWLRAHVGDYDVAHLHALFSFSTTAAAMAAHRRGVPYIVRPLGVLARYGMAQHAGLKQLSWHLVERHVLKGAAAVHFTSIAERDEARRLPGLWQSAVVPLGVELGGFSTTRDRAWLKTHAPHFAHDVVFLFLSRIHPKKRLDLVIAAVQRLRADGVRAALVVAGAGEPGYVAQLQKTTDGVHWAGHVHGAEKLALLAAADAFVLPSINENFGIAVVEALASGLPVVITEGVAIHREIERANAGMIVDAAVEALAGALHRLVAGDVRRQLGANGRALAEQEFSVEAMARGISALYERAVRTA